MLEGRSSADAEADVFGHPMKTASEWTTSCVLFAAKIKQKMH